MLISSLKIKNFRNYSNFVINFDPEGALILGENGIGKTNLLESISFFAFGKSFQTSRDLELINFSKAFFRIEADFIIQNKSHFYEAASDRSRKIIKINSVNIARISDLYKYLKVVYFSPNDIEIIAGSPLYRRNFIDQAISQYSFEYIELLRTYRRILKQRNALFKTNYSRKEKRVWDEQFAHVGSNIIKLRLYYLDQFTPLLEKHYKDISEAREELSVCYKYSFPNDTDEIFDNLMDHLLRIEEQEKHQERSLAGPHLDDIDIFIDSRSARNFSSQGQKRSIAIAMRLVQTELIKEKDDDTPILMFDDVLADLDKTRTERIIEMLKGKHQIFIATPNFTNYRSFGLPEIDLKKEIRKTSEV
ncbi:MAG: DNA replication/repair protein RecF [FCB group bacterium]|nr:DNA replication/repair protein RecF [FCB group bacterium]